VRAAAGVALGHAVEAPEELEVLAPGQALVDGRVLAGEPDSLAQQTGVLDHVEAVHAGGPAVRLEQGREDADGRGLAGAVRPEQAEHRSLLGKQINTIECSHVAVLLAESLSLDRWGHWLEASEARAGLGAHTTSGWVPRTRRPTCSGGTG